MNALSRSLSSIPMWIVQTVVSILLTGSMAWGTWATVTSWKHEADIRVVKSEVDTVHDGMKEMRQDLKSIDQKLDRLIERESTPRVSAP